VRRRLVGSLAAAWLGLSAGLAGVRGAEEDWPNWRGPRQDRHALESGLVEKWSPDGGADGNLLWKRADLGSRSTPIVLRGRLYTLARHQPGTVNEGEKVVCVDARTGDTLWEHRFNVSLSEVPDTRVAWSSCAGDPETGRIYAQGVSGYFCCLEGETGEVVWSKRLHEELGLISTYGGRTNVPVVFEDLVLISAVVVGWGDAAEFGGLAKPAHRFMAFDKANGELRWLNGTNISPYDTTYSTPMVAAPGGEAQLVFGSGDGYLWSLQPRTGKRLWWYPLSRAGVNVSPLVVGDRVYASHSEENVVGNTMGAVVALDATQRGDLSGKELWLAPQVMAGKASPVMVEDRLWVVDDRAKLFLFDPETGKSLFEKKLGRFMRSTPLAADGKVYACTNEGTWHALRPAPTGVKVLSTVRLGDNSNEGSPIAAHRRLYLPTIEALYCLGDASAAADGEAGPTAGISIAETPRESDSQPAQLQLAPYDVLLQPGERCAFQARLFNARGQFLRVAEASEVAFQAFGPGTMGAGGTFAAATEAGHAVVRVECRVGGLKAQSRVRIVPPLPWAWDFDRDEDLPAGWIGGRVRYVLRKDEDSGERFAVKRDILPTPRDPDNKLGTRSQLFMGPVDLAEYTIEGDVRITEKNGRLPDVGLINSGYALTLRSESQQLRAYSWSSHDYRTFAAVPFKPELGVWYRLKFEVRQEGNHAVVRGKIWPRDEEQPAAWTVRMIDEAPNRSGSPGIYGNSQETEFFLDNVAVYPNK